MRDIFLALLLICVECATYFTFWQQSILLVELLYGCEHEQVGLIHRHETILSGYCCCSQRLLARYLKCGGIVHVGLASGHLTCRHTSDCVQDFGCSNVTSSPTNRVRFLAQQLMYRPYHIGPRCGTVSCDGRQVLYPCSAW